MGDLGDLLERLHGARHSWRSVQATVRRWADSDLTRKAFERQVPPAGEVVRSPSETFPRPEHLTIEEVTAQAPFTVLVPERLPEGGRLVVRFHPGRCRVQPSVWLTVHSPDRLHRLSLQESADPMPDGLDWEEADGMLIFDGGGGIEIKRELLGTHARLSGDYDRATMIEIAASLRPAPTEPPHLTDATPRP